MPLFLCYNPLPMVKPFVKDTSVPPMKEGDAIPVQYIEPIASAKLIERGVTPTDGVVRQKISQASVQTVEDVLSVLGID